MLEHHKKPLFISTVFQILDTNGKLHHHPIRTLMMLRWASLHIRSRNIIIQGFAKNKQAVPLGKSLDMGQFGEIKYTVSFHVIDMDATKCIMIPAVDNKFLNYPFRICVCLQSRKKRLNPKRLNNF